MSEPTSSLSKQAYKLIWWTSSALKKAISDEKQKIADETWEHVKVLVEKKKQELDDSVRHDELENREEFETAALKLKNTFEANKDKWCDDIYERCLH